ncbi:hypothetical protein [Sandaracinus amylolyticus]|uniref:Alkyl hydroperoxide reductase subunit C/ Thiol specific antioxidant domain-containing protein n=1 Tax=Sandaracinus amylolyticus TaxID=927083 RepID=A0A0F6YN46_9BACT|nr:hypothetical protein [Sandaracinus amylolyticus]AKF10870.1 hypothetical protein DB32_008019 [Sandaracinus amylolyticus]
MPNCDISSLDIELESSSGGRRRLSEHRGRVVVVFWEDRDHLGDNRALKDALSAIAQDRELGRELSIVAIGDVNAFDFAPARNVVRAAIAAIARTIGVEILFDWQGAMTAAPFSFVRGESNVLVIDREGRALLRCTGALDPSQQRRVLDRVRGAIGPRTRVAA